MCRWLELVAEFDRREGWGAWGARSCAHWLNWKCGLSMVAAHEHVRVARRLTELPLVRKAFSAGQLSYSKARALTRIATPRTEQQLVELAGHATAAHLDRIARAHKTVTKADEREEAKRRSEARHLHYFWDDDGSLVLTARLAPEEGALVLQALDAADHALRNEAKADDSSAEDSTSGAGESSAEEWITSGDASAGGAGESSAEEWITPEEPCAGEAGESSAEEWITSEPSASSGEESVPPPDAGPPKRAGSERDVPANRADALVAMAETMLHHGPAARDGGDKYQVVVLVGAEVLAGVGDHSVEGRCEVEDGPRLAPATALRLACDAAVVAASLKSGGEPLNVGRSTQSIPRGIRRALRLRDGGCRFPGCTQTRFVDGHHIVHWAHGGETSLANLVLLCRFHHRAIHERGFGVVRSDEGRLLFTTPSGAVVPAVPAPEPAVDLDVEAMNRHLGVVLSSDTGATLWGGERLDLGLAIDALMCLEGRNLPDDDATRPSADPD